MTLTDRDWHPFGITEDDYPEPDQGGIRWLHLGRGPKLGQTTDRAGAWLLAAASVLLLALAFTQGFVSWHQQFVFVLAAKHDRTVSGLEALGLDSAAVIFAVLAVALARLGQAGPDRAGAQPRLRARVDAHERSWRRPWQPAVGRGVRAAAGAVRGRESTG